MTKSDECPIDDVEMMDDEEMDEENETCEDIPEHEKKVYIPGVSRPLKEGEQLDFDPDAYKMFHSFETNWPCLTFDVVEDGLGDNRTEFPYECYMVSGTQADKPKANEIIVMGLKNLTGLHNDEESDDESDDEDEEKAKKDEPVMHSVVIPNMYGTNRIKCERLGDSSVCAVWNDFGRVQLWNLTNALNKVNQMTGETKSEKMADEKPLFTFQGSKKEGFALAWCPTKKGDLVSGDVVRNIYVWHMQEGGTWAVDQRALTGHSKSVEDLAWSPTEQGLLASCSADGSIKLWDSRSPPASACVCTVEKAHNSDVNVISWNQHDSLIVSGGDDAELKVWSLKTIQFGQPVARFKHHTKPITSVEWHPTDTTTFMASGEDDQTSIWDIATEADGSENIEGVPPQLMFLHLGQSEIKEVHWHKQIPGLALNTALSGFNLFRTINI